MSLENLNSPITPYTSFERPRGKSIALLEGIFHFIALMTMSRGIFPIFLEDARMVYGDAGSLEIRYTLLFIYLVTLVLLLPHWRKVRDAVLADPFLWSLMLWAMVSVVWSLDPAITFRRSASLACTMAYALYLSIRYDSRKLLNIFACFLFGAILFSLALILLFPHLAEGYIGTGKAWIGIYAHRNAFGRMMSLAVLLFGLKANYGGRFRVVTLSGLVLALVLLLLSQSKTGLVTCISVAICYPFYTILMRGPKKLVAALIPFYLLGGIGAIWFAWLHIEPLTLAIGRDPTLTGRVYVWDAAWVGLRDHLFLGYGYNAFWAGPWNPLKNFMVGVSWVPSHAHNGILNLWLDLGLIGVSVFLISYLRCFLKSVKFASEGIGISAKWPLIFLIYFASYNVAESSIMVVAGTPCIFWILYVCASRSVNNPGHNEAK